MIEVKKQVKNDLNIKEYNNRILVTGLPESVTKEKFYFEIGSYVNSLEEDVIFLSIDEKEGPEKWIVEWCRDNNYPCLILDRKQDDYDRLNKYCYMSNNIVIITNCDYEFKVIIDLAKKHKTKITKILVEK